MKRVRVPLLILLLLPALMLLAFAVRHPVVAIAQTTSQTLAEALGAASSDGWTIVDPATEGSTPYQFADDPENPAQLDVPFASVESASAGLFLFGDGVEVNCSDASQLCSEGFTAADSEVLYLGFSMTMAGDIPPEGADGLTINYSFQWIAEGQDPFVELDVFPGDTWQDMSQVVIAESGSPFGLEHVMCNSGFGFATQPTLTFGLVDGRQIWVFVPVGHDGFGIRETVIANAIAQVLADPNPDGSVSLPQALADAIATTRWGAAVHVHQGDFGSVQPSTITAIPQTPRDPGSGLLPPTKLTLIGFGPTVDIPPAEPAPQPTTATQEPSSTPDPAVTATETTDPASGGETVSAGKLEDDSNAGLFLKVLLGLGAVSGGVYLVTKKKRFSGIDCNCEIAVNVRGPNTLRRCCMPLTAALGPVEGVAVDGDSAIDAPWRTHLDIDIEGKDGWDYSDHVLEAKPHVKVCGGGASVDLDAATYEWSVTTTDDEISVTCTVTAPVKCANGQEHPGVSATDTHHIRLRDTKCKISLLVEWHGYTDVTTVEHADVMIECGEYQQVFGFFPKKKDWAVLTGTPGMVKRWSRRHANVGKRGLTAISDDLGSKHPSEVSNHVGASVGTDFNRYIGSIYRSMRYTFIPEDCNACELIRTWWEDLEANPYEYFITSQNCVTSAWNSLKAAGLWGEYWGEPMTGSQLRGQMTAVANSTNDNFTMPEPDRMQKED